jgi:signal transduction histidine kinase/CheY-like chemotaxis protein
VAASLIWPEASGELCGAPAASVLALSAALAIRRQSPAASQALALLVAAFQLVVLAPGILPPSIATWAGAPGAAAACLLAASALLVLARWPFAAAFLGSLVFTVGGVAAIAHAVGEPAAFSWGRSPAMKLPAALVLIVLSPGIVAAAFRRVRPAVQRALRWAELLVGPMVAVAGALFWLGLRSEAEAQRTRTMEAAARGMAGEVAARVDFMVEALERLAQHGAGIGGWRSRADWASDARISLGSFSGFVAAEWIDADFAIRALAPAGQGHRPLYRLPGAGQRFRAAVARARERQAPAIAGPFRLSDGRDAFRIVLPLAAVGQPEAFLSGLFSFEGSFAALFANSAPDYDVGLTCGSRRVLQRGSGNLAPPLGSSGVALADDGSAWTLVAAPHPDTLARLGSRLPEVALGAGLLVGALLSVVIRLAGAAYLRAWRFEQAVRDRTRDVEAVSAAKDRFMTVLSHELRNPLGSISNAVEALSGGDETTRRRMQAIIARQAGHLKRLVDDLLDATRIERGMVSLELRPVALSLELRQTAEAVRDRIEGAGIGLSLELPVEELWVVADPTRLDQIVGNLLANAAKFTPRGGLIAVVARNDGDVASIAVRDTGPGIAPSEMTLLFEPFVQSEEAVRQGRGGLGLGLSIVKGLAEACGGSVEARSAGRGQGAEFVIRLPRCSPAPESVHRALGGVNGRQRRILIIDDHVDSAEGLAELLRRAEHAVEVTADGESGLESARRRRPDLVICDLGLPLLDGFAVARVLRADPRLRTLPLVALSGFGDEPSIVRARDAGFDRYLTKPIDPEVLRQLASGTWDPRDRARPSEA